jgi:hypothetical protein
MSRLPGSVQDVAEIIGEEKALELVSKARRSYPPSRVGNGTQGKVYETVQVYVPCNISPNHELVQQIGWEAASKLSRHFGGEILKLGNCADLRRQHRNDAIKRMARSGVPEALLAEWFKVSPRTVANVLSERPQRANQAT